MLRLHLLPAVLAFFTATTAALALPQPSTELLSKRALTLTLPSSSLQDPTTISPAVSLKYVVLGVGTQNYTCAATPNSGSAPVQVGALAKLFDAGQFLQTFPDLIPTLPGIALGLYSMTGADMSQAMGYVALGTHFYNSAGQPTFDLAKVGAKITAKKLANTAAPANACPGPNKAGAVDWVQLTDNGAGLTYGGLSYVYRVETAGGKPPATCSGESGAFQVNYATEYWFYGP